MAQLCKCCLKSAGIGEVNSVYEIIINGKTMHIRDLMGTCAKTIVEEQCAPFGEFVRDYLREGTPNDFGVILRNPDRSYTKGEFHTIERVKFLIKKLKSTIPYLTFSLAKNRDMTYSAFNKTEIVKTVSVKTKSLLKKSKFLFNIEFVGFESLVEICEWSQYGRRIATEPVLNVDCLINALWMTEEGISTMPFSNMNQFSGAMSALEFAKFQINEKVFEINNRQGNVLCQSFWERMLKLLVQGWHMKLYSNKYSYHSNSQSIYTIDDEIPVKVCDAYGQFGFAMHMITRCTEERNLEDEFENTYKFSGGERRKRIQNHRKKIIITANAQALVDRSYYFSNRQDGEKNPKKSPKSVTFDNFACGL
jgi:hypothetical protein